MCRTTHKLVSIAHHSSLHLESIVDDALDLDRLETNNFKVKNKLFDIRATCNEIAQIMKIQIKEKGLRLNFSINSRVQRMIESDQKRFKQILFTLIGNALKYTYEGTISLNVD